MKAFNTSVALVGALLMAGCGDPGSNGSVAADQQTSERIAAGDVHWITDFEAAKASAAKDDRLILANFTGSDWCAPCGMLRREIFSTAEFAEYAAANLVLLELDFPQSIPQSDELKRQNRELSEKYHVPGFPTLLLLRPDGEEVKRSVGHMRGGPTKFIEWANAARTE